VFGAGARPDAIVLTHIHPDHAGSALELARLWDLPVHVHPAELPMAGGRYLPQYANPLDRWLIAPLLALVPRRMVARARHGPAWQARPGGSIQRPECLACRTGRRYPPLATRRATWRSSAPGTAC
jgi:glyoxylase-like metal-dependent hydrolase (beta-lactamase superfamily II)